MHPAKSNPFIVAVIGAGPAGLFAARQLAAEGVQVVLFNRDIKPGGLAEYGIYPTKYKMKQGLRRQFRQILEDPDIHYFGNLTIGVQADLSLDDLKALGFHARLVTVGAQGTKWLGLPGEETPAGVYHAKDLVYHYNSLPPFSQQQFLIGRKVALIGAGNVMLDIARWVIRTIKVDEVTAIVRRGPAEVKFDKKEMQSVIANLDLAAFETELQRVSPVMEAVGQDINAARDFILAPLPKADPAVSSTRFYFDFLASPTRILSDDAGQVNGLEIEDTTLVPYNGDTKARRTGNTRTLDVDTVIFCIGDRVDQSFGLPMQWNEFVKNQEPRFPVDGLSYEVSDPEHKLALEDIFVAGWSREASSGLVGVARKDGERGARAVLQYLDTLETAADPASVLSSLKARFSALDKPIIHKADVYQLYEIEQQEAERLGLDDFKFKSNDEMLAVISLPTTTD